MYSNHYSNLIIIKLAQTIYQLSLSFLIHCNIIKVGSILTAKRKKKRILNQLIAFMNEWQITPHTVQIL